MPQYQRKSSRTLTIAFCVCACLLVLALLALLLGCLLWRREGGGAAAAASEAEMDAEEVVDAEEEVDAEEDPVDDEASHLTPDRLVHNVSIQQGGESRPFVSSLEQQYRCVMAGEPARTKLRLEQAAKLHAAGWRCEDMLYRGRLDVVKLAKLEETPRREGRAPHDVAPAPSLSGWEAPGKRSQYVEPAE
jgi:hypothetical protein